MGKGGNGCGGGLTILKLGQSYYSPALPPGYCSVHPGQEALSPPGAIFWPVCRKCEHCWGPNTASRECSLSQEWDPPILMPNLGLPNLLPNYSTVAAGLGPIVAGPAVVGPVVAPQLEASGRVVTPEPVAPGPGIRAGVPVPNSPVPVPHVPRYNRADHQPM